MKKTITILTTAVTAVLLVAFSIGFTLAYFTDKDTTVGTNVTAGSLEVSVDLALANYGVPSDTLLTAYGSKAAPAKSTVTVTNQGSMDMDYTLSLTVNKATSNLLAANGFELTSADGTPLKFTGNPTVDANGNVTYVYKSTDALKNGEINVFGLALTFQGATLIDGNDYQGLEISIEPTVIAIQTGGDE